METFVPPFILSLINCLVLTRKKIFNPFTNSTTFIVDGACDAEFKDASFLQSDRLKIVF